MSVVTKQGFSLNIVTLGREPKALAESRPEDPTLPWASFLPSDVLLVPPTDQILARSQKRTVGGYKSAGKESRQTDL